MRFEFWNVGGSVDPSYPGSFPSGLWDRMKLSTWWGTKRLHLCSGTIRDGVTVDLNRQVRPTVRANLVHGIPFRDESFDTITFDPPYSETISNDVYGKPYVTPSLMIKEASRVLMPGGHMLILDYRVWPPWPGLTWDALIAVHQFVESPHGMRALAVYRKLGHVAQRTIDDWPGDGERDP